LGEAASLTAGPKFVKGLRVRALPRAQPAAAVFLICARIVQLVWESSNFTGSSVPLIESLKSKAHLITDAWKRKNLTHLQLVLLFKDSRARRWNEIKVTYQPPAHFQRNPLGRGRLAVFPSGGAGLAPYVSI
jgi:hypothetical protein